MFDTVGESLAAVMPLVWWWHAAAAGGLILTAVAVVGLAFHTFQRMVFWELVRVFLMSLFGLTALFVIVGVVQQASQYGLNLSQVLTIIPLTIPTSFPYTIPATTLFASCVAYGRLSHDNEAVVLKAAGVNLYTMLWPAALLGVLAAGLTAASAHTVIPSCWRRIQQEAIRDPEEAIYNILRRERMFKSASSSWVLYVRDVQGRRLVDVVVKRRRPGSADEYDFVARTRQAKLRVDVAKKELTVDDDESDNSWTASSTLSEMQSNNNKPIVVPLPEEYTRERLEKLFLGRPQAINWPDLRAKADEWLTGAEGRAPALHVRAALLAPPPSAVLTPAEIGALAAEYRIEVGRIPPQPDERAKQAQHYLEVAKFTAYNARTLTADWYMRPALAFGCLVFAVIGCPVGLWVNRGDYLSIFVVCFLPTLFSYYPLLLSGSGLARDDKVPMVVGVWAANALGLIGAAILTWRLVKR